MAQIIVQTNGGRRLLEYDTKNIDLRKPGQTPRRELLNKILTAVLQAESLEEAPETA